MYATRMKRKFLFISCFCYLLTFFSKGREISEDDDDYSGDEASSEESSVFDEKAFESKLCDPSSDAQIEVRFFLTFRFSSMLMCCV